MEQASLLKRILDALKDLVEDTNFDCGPVRRSARAIRAAAADRPRPRAQEGIVLQAMDSAHVALVHLSAFCDPRAPAARGPLWAAAAALRPAGLRCGRSLKRRRAAAVVGVRGDASGAADVCGTLEGCLSCTETPRRLPSRRCCAPARG